MTNPDDKLMVAGVTLIELLVVVLVAAILAALAVPSYKRYMANSKASELATRLTTVIRQVKSEALHRNLPVKLCALTSTSGTSCGPACTYAFTCNDTASNWTYGWQIIVPSTDETLFISQPSSANAIKISPASSITFSPSGFPSPQTFSFSIKPTGCSQGLTLDYSTTAPGGLFKTTITTCP